MKNKKNGLFNKEDRKKLNIKMRLKDYGKLDQKFINKKNKKNKKRMLNSKKLKN